MFVPSEVKFDEREKPKIFAAADADEFNDELDSEEGVVIESKNRLEGVQPENVIKPATSCRTILKGFTFYVQ